jgi:hypothetical protein
MTAAATLLEDLDELERRLTKPHHVLVVANETCDNPSLCAAIVAHVGRRADVLVVTPALPSLASRWTPTTTARYAGRRTACGRR